MKSKAYRSIDVKQIDLSQCLEGRDGKEVHAGLDIGKETILSTLRWGINDFDRPWRVRNPFDVAQLAKLLKEVGQGRKLVVAMEPTGTYGDALRQALQKEELTVHRVSPKSASDYSEVFDGVPSQHDGKDAAVIADLAAQGRSWPWPMKTASDAEGELKHRVQWLDAQRRQMMLWCGRVEALLSRHWPEATRVMKLSSGTLLKCLAKYGGPQGLKGEDALQEVRRWGGTYLSAKKAQALVDSARQTAGVVMGRWEEEDLRQYAREIQKCQSQMRQAKRRMSELTQEHGTIRLMSQVVGMATACVLWVELGDPSSYHCGAAYRKAMGLNLAEHSSGKWEGKLKLSKRGSSQARRWLYLAALRWVKSDPVRSWYLKQKAQRRGQGKPAVVGVMRKLALALYHVGGRGEVFDQNQLYRSLTALPPAAA